MFWFYKGGAYQNHVTAQLERLKQLLLLALNLKDQISHTKKSFAVGLYASFRLSVNSLAHF